VYNAQFVVSLFLCINVKKFIRRPVESGKEKVILGPATLKSKPECTNNLLKRKIRNICRQTGPLETVFPGPVVALDARVYARESLHIYTDQRLIGFKSSGGSAKRSPNSQ